ncbi:SAM-dependent methyltransferase, partial [Amycolatopsis sp. NPDC058278]
TRTADEVVAGVFSLSSSAPHLFGERRAAFEADLRRRLAPAETFTVRLREIAVDLWFTRGC